MGNLAEPLFVQEEIPIQNSVIREFGIEAVTGNSFDIVDGGPSSAGFSSYLLTCDPASGRTHQEKNNREGKKIYEWSYDEPGKLVQEIAYEESGSINYKIETSYAEDDIWQEKRVLLSGDRLHYRIVASRDAEGRISKGVYYDPSGQVIQTDSYNYDERGRLVSVSMGPAGEWIYEYDAGDNLSRKTGNLPSASGFGQSFEFHYDDRGLLVRRDHLNYSVTIFDYRFRPSDSTERD